MLTTRLPSHPIFLKHCVKLTGTRQVFRQRATADALELVSRLLEYTPSLRLSPIDATAHHYFDELRDPATRLPPGRELPPLFNFTAAGRHARTHARTTLTLSANSTKLCDRSFSASGPQLWNNPAPGLRRPGLTFDSFRQSLKSHLFGDRSAQ